MYETAVEAAVAYARAVGSVAGGDSDDGHGEHAEAAEKEAKQEQQQVVEEAEGWRLHLSSSGSTGYTRVRRKPSGRFEATINRHGKHRSWLPTAEWPRPCLTTAPHPPARCLLEPRPRLRTPERRLSHLKACGGPSSPPTAVPKLRMLPSLNEQAPLPRLV